MLPMLLAAMRVDTMPPRVVANISWIVLRLFSLWTSSLVNGDHLAGFVAKQGGGHESILI